MAFHEVRLASTHSISTLAISTDETKVAAILLPICKIIEMYFFNKHLAFWVLSL
jgi:hypothetical protein